MASIICVLIFIEFLTIVIVAIGWYSMQRLHDEMLKISRKPPQVDLNPVYNDIRTIRSDIAEQAKSIETLKSAIVLKSAFK